MNPQPSAAARRAALTLHGLPPGDCEWILRALPDEHRAALQPLLQELAALGIPRDAQALDTLAQSAGAVSGRPPAGRDDGQAAAAAALLRSEPPRLIAEVLAARNWSWREQVAAMLEGTDPLPQAQAAPALREAVVTLVESRLACEPARCAEPHPRRTWRAWWPRKEGTR